jgi:hypothetical protein
LAKGNSGFGGGRIGTDKTFAHGGSALGIDKSGCSGGDIGKDKGPTPGYQLWLQTTTAAAAARSARIRAPIHVGSLLATCNSGCSGSSTGKENDPTSGDLALGINNSSCGGDAVYITRPL